MSVELDPPEQLEFNRPFTQQVARYLRVRNPHDTPVAYKVKTTAPRSYCVRPNSGRIEPGEEIEVQVLLQAMKVDVPLDVKCKDKFLLQSTKINNSIDEANLSELWAQVEKDVAEGKQAKDVIHQRKIRCVWGPPLDANGNHAHSAAADHFVDTPSKANGVPGHQETPQVKPPAAAGTNAYSTPSALPPLVPTTPPEEEIRSSTAQTTSLEAQLAEARAQIVALTKQLNASGGSGLRQRNNNTADTSTVKPSSARGLVHTAAEQGVPVRIVAYLCLAAFLLAYLFF